VTVLDARRDDRDTAPVRALRVESGAYLVVNASFFDHENRPLGLVIADGVRQSNLRNLDQGVFLISNGQPRIQGSRDPLPEHIDMAVQSFPRLVIEGSPIRLKPKPSRRTVLCVPGDGSLVIIIVSQAISLPDLAMSLADPVTEGGLGCWSALNLDGGSSTQASILTPTLTLEVPGTGPVPNGLAVLPRSTEGAPSDDAPKL
jgi:uncharacterized protein YigE (DUF2233 family)